MLVAVFFRDSTDTSFFDAAMSGWFRSRSTTEFVALRRLLESALFLMSLSLSSRKVRIVVSSTEALSGR